jgi:PAS domain S-box-containing protein
MFYSPDRALDFDFAPPHNINHCVAVVRRGQGPAPSFLSELEGKSIVVQNGDIMHDFAVENGISQRLVSVESQEEALRELAMGKHDCALVARRTAFYWIEKYGWDNLVVGRHAFLSPEYCFAVQKGRKALLAQLSEGLKALEESGEYRQIFDKWMGVYDRKPDLGRILQNAAIFLAPFLLIFLGAMAWSWSLRRQVARRTAELKESEQHFRNLANSGSALIWTADTEKQLNYCNQVWFDFTGRTMEQEKGEGWIKGVHPDDRMKCVNTFYDAFDRHERFSMVYRLLAHDGQYRWVQDNGGPRYDTGGRFIGYIGHCLDITEFKLAKERIEHLNNVLRAIRDVNQLIVRERDRDSLINDACRLLVDNRGYTGVLIILTDDEQKPVSWAQAGMDDAPMQESLIYRKELPACCKKAALEGRVVTIEEQDKLCGQCPFSDQCLGQDIMCVLLENDGHVYGYLSVALAHGLGKDDEEQALFAEMADDIAYALSVLQLQKEQEALEQKRLSLENQLQQAQKMESVGRLAGGVAHDYNNMLSVIIGYAELALDKLSPSDQLYGDLTEILNAAQRSNAITRQLLAFARKQTINPKVLDLNETVESMLKMLRRLMGENVELYWRPAPGLRHVKMDPVQIDQILANLCVNARDAISGMGSITIETRNIKADDKYCLDHVGSVPGKYVMLAVSDDGCGMDGDMIKNIFEPFYTTKDSSRGTGLGLATVYGIVRQNNGFINVYSEPGKGTTFKLYFPGHEGKKGSKVSRRVQDIPEGDGETILLVEDEPEIMTMGRIMLERLGYRVLASQSPAEAVFIARDHEKNIDLLITDIVMPEINGRELAGRLQSMYPGLKVLFMSGYTADVIGHHGVLKEGIDFIEKPFSMRDLGEKVKRMLQKGSVSL